VCIADSWITSLKYFARVGLIVYFPLRRNDVVRYVVILYPPLRLFAGFLKSNNLSVRRANCAKKADHTELDFVNGLRWPRLRYIRRGCSTQISRTWHCRISAFFVARRIRSAVSDVGLAA